MEHLGIVSILCVLLVSHVHPVNSQCAGTVMVLNASDAYQIFTSPNYPSGYSNQLSCEWRIEADDASDAIRLEITDIETEYHPECVHDFGEAFDGDNVNATSLGKFCGTTTSSFVSYDSNMTVTFTSDYSMTMKGFKARYICGPRSSLVDEEAGSSGLLIFIIAGAGGLAAILVVVIAVIICKKKQSNSGKDARSIQVQPFAATSNWSQQRNQPLHHPPPAFGDSTSTNSPPPRYSDVGLPTTMPRAAEFGKQDGVRNTHFVLPNNLGHTPNPSQAAYSTATTTGISNNSSTGSLPNVDNLAGSMNIGGPATVAQSTDNATVADSTNPPLAPTAANNLAGVGVPTIPRRNVPGETLSEVLSDSDDSDSDSDDFSDSD